MADSKTTILWRERQAQFNAMTAELSKLAAEEYPPGTRVRWTHTFRAGVPVRREGVVKSMYGHGLNVQINMDGPLHRVEAYLAEVIG